MLESLNERKRRLSIYYIRLLYKKIERKERYYNSENIHRGDSMKIRYYKKWKEKILKGLKSLIEL